MASIAKHKLYENFSDYFLIMIYDYCVFMRFYKKLNLQDSRENKEKLSHFCGFSIVFINSRRKLEVVHIKHKIMNSTQKFSIVFWDQMHLIFQELILDIMRNEIGLTLPDKDFGSRHCLPAGSL